MIVCEYLERSPLPHLPFPRLTPISKCPLVPFHGNDLCRKMLIFWILTVSLHLFLAFLPFCIPSFSKFIIAEFITLVYRLGGLESSVEHGGRAKLGEELCRFTDYC